MPLEYDDCNGVSVITVRGDLVAEQASAIRQSLGTRAVRPNIVIDLESCRFFASIGLEALLDMQRTCEERGGRLMLAGLDDNCRKILEITRLGHRFECHRQVATALKSM